MQPLQPARMGHVFSEEGSSPVGKITQHCLRRHQGKCSTNQECKHVLPMSNRESGAKLLKCALLRNFSQPSRSFAIPTPPSQRGTAIQLSSASNPFCPKDHRRDLASLRHQGRESDSRLLMNLINSCLEFQQPLHLGGPYRQPPNR